MEFAAFGFERDFELLLLAGAPFGIDTVQSDDGLQGLGDCRGDFGEAAAEFGAASAGRGEIEDAGLIGVVEAVRVVVELDGEDGGIAAVEAGGDLAHLFVDEGFREAAAHIAGVTGVDHRVGVILAVVADGGVADEEDGDADLGFGGDAVTELLGLFDGVEEAGASGDGSGLDGFLELVAGFLGIEEDSEAVLGTEEGDAGVGREFFEFFEEGGAGRIDEGEIAGPIEDEEDEEVVGLVEEASDFERLAVDGELEFGGFGGCAIGEPEGDADAGGGGFGGRWRLCGKRECREEERRGERGGSEAGCCS